MTRRQPGGGQNVDLPSPQHREGLFVGSRGEGHLMTVALQNTRHFPSTGLMEGQRDMADTDGVCHDCLEWVVEG